MWGTFRVDFIWTAPFFATCDPKVLELLFLLVTLLILVMIDGEIKLLLD